MCHLNARYKMLPMCPEYTPQTSDLRPQTSDLRLTLVKPAIQLITFYNESIDTNELPQYLPL